MKRAFAALTVLIILCSMMPKYSGASSARLFYTSGSPVAPDETAGGDGLYTDIPYVPEYTGELSSQSRVILMDLATGCILIEQNGDVRAYPASTTKIMTAVLLIENTQDDQWDMPIPPLAKVNSDESAEGSQLGLKPGDQPTRRDLLYGLLLPSGCDCAYVVANIIAGSEEEFVFMMNTRASEIGMNNTGYENSYGLASNGHYTTAEDMATLVRHAMQYPLFRSTVATASKTLTFMNYGTLRSIHTTNTNYLLRSDSQYYYPYAIGVKTGTATIADHCLTSAASKNGLELAAVVMNSDNNDERYTFSKDLLEWGYRYYASEGGYYSMTITNALFKAGPDGCGIYSAPDSSDSANLPVNTLTPGAAMRVGAYRYDNNGALWYMVWCGDCFRWAKSLEMEFVSYVNDIKIETGDALSGVVLMGRDKPVDSVISSRHIVKAVTVTVYNEDGEPMTGGSNYPAASCTHTLLGTTVDNDVDLGLLEPGVYNCSIHVEAVAYVPDAPDREYFKVDEYSTLLVVSDSIGTEPDGSPMFEEYTLSYNANTGSGAPEGDTARLGASFTVSDAEPVKPGCVFAGWNTAPDGSGTVYHAGDKIPSRGSCILYAMWAPGEYEWLSSLEAKADGGAILFTGELTNTIGITDALLTLTSLSDGKTIFSKEAATPSNTVSAEEFAEELSTLELTDGQYALMLTASAGVSAPEKVFEELIEITSRPVYSIMLVTNGGAITGINTDELTVICGEPFGELPVPQKEGMVFVAWFDNDENRVYPDTVVPESSNGVIVLHANWQDASSTSSPGNHIPGNQSGLAAIPLWVWLAAGLLLVAGLITAIIVIIKHPNEEVEEGDDTESEDDGQ